MCVCGLQETYFTRIHNFVRLRIFKKHFQKLHDRHWWNGCVGLMASNHLNKMDIKENQLIPQIMISVKHAVSQKHLKVITQFVCDENKLKKIYICIFYNALMTLICFYIILWPKTEILPFTLWNKTRHQKAYNVK